MVTLSVACFAPAATLWTLSRRSRRLADRLRALGGRPQRRNSESRDAFFKRWDEVQRIVLSESLLRRCRAARSNPSALVDGLDTEVPLVDAHDELVDVARYGR
jgi:hypothetical protein